MSCYLSTKEAGADRCFTKASRARLVPVSLSATTRENRSSQHHVHLPTLGNSWERLEVRGRSNLATLFPPSFRLVAYNVAFTCACVLPGRISHINSTSIHVPIRRKQVTIGNKGVCERCDLLAPFSFIYSFFLSLSATSASRERISQYRV